MGDWGGGVRVESAPGRRDLGGSWTRTAMNDYYNDHMDRKMTATEVKAKILGLLDEVAAGEEIEITKHGRTVARLVPARGARSLEGLFEGLVRTNVEDEEELFSTGERWHAQ